MVKKWEIYFADLNPATGSEQRGVRPVLIISNDAVNDRLPICTIIPFSSFKAGDKVYPSELYLEKKDTGLSKDSILMFQQIRTIDQSRIVAPVAGLIIKDETRARITKSLLNYFDLF